MMRCVRRLRCSSVAQSSSALKLTAFLPDVLDPAAHDVPPGLSQSLTGTHAAPLLPAQRPGQTNKRSTSSKTPTEILHLKKTLFLQREPQKMSWVSFWTEWKTSTYLCEFFLFIMFAVTPECPVDQKHQWLLSSVWILTFTLYYTFCSSNV